MNCPQAVCSGTIAILLTYDDILGTEKPHYFPCTECRGTYRRNIMPEMRNNISCPKPGCPGSRCDITITDENGNYVGTRSEPCNVCGS
jgi:hypothetical protein